MKRVPGRISGHLCAIVLVLVCVPGCATMRRQAESPDLRPCADGYAYTKDGWRLGMRRIAPTVPDRGKLPVVLCHGLGLNGTFWTITDDHLPAQLAARGYDVFIVDLRGSGESAREGKVGEINARLRETPFLELGEGLWNVDEMAFFDVPAVLDYVQRQTGQVRVNWVGHSLGGMLIFPFLELSPDAPRIANFVGMGSTVTLAEAPQKDMLRANRGLRVLSRFVSTGRVGRPLMHFRFPGLDRIDQFYYTSENVDRQTTSRFYGYTLEDPGRSALRQLAPYLEFGHFVSADRKVDYSALLPRVTTSTLMVAGEQRLHVRRPLDRADASLRPCRAPDKSLMRFGKRDGQVADYGHCDLVWSRYAPREIFPSLIAWLDQRQPGAAPMPSPQATTTRSSLPPPL